MTKVNKIRLVPLEGKYYSTEIDLYVDGDGWTSDGYAMRVVVCGGSHSGPSQREYERGYYTDEGMNHVESKAAYDIALAICEALRELK